MSTLYFLIKGTYILIADTLSRAHREDSGNNQGDGIRITNVSVVFDISDKRPDEIREATSRDANL